MRQTRMIIKRDIIVIVISVVIAAAIPFVYMGRERKKIQCKTFHTSAGWGYDILVGNRLLIHQQFVPAIAEKKGFDTEASAKKIARLVIDKLENNKLPTITHHELTQICSN